jgi:hypothetical protein
MPKIVACTKCGMKLGIPENAAGQAVQCPGCKTVFKVAGDGTAPAAAPKKESGAASKTKPPPSSDIKKMPAPPPSRKVPKGNDDFAFAFDDSKTRSRGQRHDADNERPGRRRERDENNDYEAARFRRGGSRTLLWVLVSVVLLALVAGGFLVWRLNQRALTAEEQLALELKKAVNDFKAFPKDFVAPDPTKKVAPKETQPQPKKEEPKKEEAKQEHPKIESPKIELPKIDEPKKEEPKQLLPPKDAKESVASKPRVLKPTDLVYKGSFAPPRVVNGTSTSYTNIALAMRLVNGKRQFFAGVYPDETGVYEMDFPGLAVVTDENKSCPNANVVKWWGDIWQGKWVVTDVTAVSKRGLYWDERSQRLYWTYGCIYPATGANDPCFGWTDLSGPTPQAHGPFRVTGGAVISTDESTKALSSSCQGGITRIPAWFAKKYTKNQTLGLGFGGFYNIISSGVSMGPALFAVSDPEDGTKDYSAIPCVAHTFVQGPAGTHYCKRSPDYDGNDDWAAPPKVKDVGYWTGRDTIHSAGCWVDLPDVTGLMFMAYMFKGTVNYDVMNNRGKGGGDPDNWLYIYNPADLGAVASGSKNPWEIDPVSRTIFPTPLGGKINGMVFQAETRTLFVLATHAIQAQYESYPLIHAYQVK